MSDLDKAALDRRITRTPEEAYPACPCTCKSEDEADWCDKPCTAAGIRDGHEEEE